MINLTLAGQLLGTAFASGLNLYATVAVIGLAVRFEWIDGVPTGLGGLGNGIVIASAIALYILELVMDRIPFAGTAWEATHTLIRPGSAAALTLLALQGAPLVLVVPAMIAAAAVALAAHGSKAGLRLMVATSPAPRPVLSLLLSLAEDAAAIGLTVAALLVPQMALAVTGASAVLLLATGPRLWRAAMLGLHATAARLRGFFNRRGWLTRDQIPRSLRALVPVEPLGRSPARATQAAVTGLDGVGAYRNGWLVFTCDGPMFVYRSALGPRRTPLTGVSQVRLRVGLITDALYINPDSKTGFPPLRTHSGGPADARGYTIFLLKDGPAPHITAAELSGNGS